MPANFPEVWSARVERNLVNADTAPWFDGIPEIDSPIIEVDANGPSESNLIHIPATDFEVDILINNTSYPIAIQEYTDTEIVLSLNKFQTKVVPLSDDQVIGASYNRIDTVTNIMTTNMTEEKYSKANHSMAPAGHTPNTPVLETTGPVVDVFNELGVKIGTRKRFIYADLVALKNSCDKAPKKWPAIGRRLVLCSDHWNDLLLDRENYGDQLVNYKTGEVAPFLASFNIYQAIENPHYNGKAKLAYNATPTLLQGEASFAFHVQNVGKKTGKTKQYFSDSKADPENQTNKLAYRHYHLITPKRQRYLAAMVSVYTAI